MLLSKYFSLDLKEFPAGQSVRALEGRRRRTQARNGSNDRRLHAHVLPEYLLVLTLPIEVVLHLNHYLPNDGKETPALRITGVIRHPPLRMIVTNGDILHPGLVRQNNPPPLFGRCHQMAHPHGRESPLHGKKTHDPSVATSELIHQFLVQARAGAEVAVAA